MRQAVWPALTFAVLAAVSALVANRGLSTYHDGLRPLMPEFRRGDLTHDELGVTAYRISIGFVIYYGLPFALATGVLVSHVVFLPADIIGVRLRSPMAAVVAAAAYGAAAALVIMAVFAGLSALLGDAAADVALLAQPLGYLLGLLPVMAVANQYGWRWAVAVGALVVVMRLAGAGLDVGGRIPGLTPDGVALLAGTAVMVGLALRTRSESPGDGARLFAANLAHLRRAAPYLMVVGALAALAANQGWLAGEPAPALLVGTGRLFDAAAVGLFTAVGFMPQVASSAAVSGAHSTQGYPDWALAAGYVSPTPVVAAAAGGAVLAAEVLGAPAWLRLLERYPDLRELGASVRDALGLVTELASLIGGFVAAQALVPGYGTLFVGGAHLLNESTGRPVMRVAVGPLAVLAMALVRGLLEVTS